MSKVGGASSNLNCGTR